MEKKKRGFFDGRYGKYLLPGVLLQSVLIGGGYATGREIVSYGAKFGAGGWIAGIGVLIGFAVVAILTFEIARLYKVYDYKSMIKELIGPLWPLFDVVYVLTMIVIIAVMASASGDIVESTTGLNYWAGVVILIGITGGLIFLEMRSSNGLRHGEPLYCMWDILFLPEWFFLQKEATSAR